MTTTTGNKISHWLVDVMEIQEPAFFKAKLLEIVGELDNQKVGALVALAEYLKTSPEAPVTFDDLVSVAKDCRDLADFVG